MALVGEDPKSSSNLIDHTSYSINQSSVPNNHWHPRWPRTWYHCIHHHHHWTTHIIPTTPITTARNDDPTPNHWTWAHVVKSPRPTQACTRTHWSNPWSLDVLNSLFLPIQDTLPSMETQIVPIPQAQSTHLPLSIVNVESSIQRRRTTETMVQKEEKVP